MCACVLMRARRARDLLSERIMWGDGGNGEKKLVGKKGGAAV